jgi:hypothetical protein
MPVKIYIDKNKVEHRIEYAFSKGLGTLSNEILNDCNQYVKEDNGGLLMSSYINSELDKGKLIWQTPYARRQYWEIRTAYTDVNPNATWKWCEAAKKAHLKQWERQAQIALRENL